MDAPFHAIVSDIKEKQKQKILSKKHKSSLSELIENLPLVNNKDSMPHSRAVLALSSRGQC